MADMSAAEHLRLGRDALVRQRREIDNAITAIDAVLAGLGQNPAAMTTTTPAAARPFIPAAMLTVPVPTVREAILMVLDDNCPRPMKTMQIIEGVRARGVVAQDDTVRSILIKLLKKGEIVRIGHGVYVSKDAETPALTGVPVESAPTGEEVTDDGTTAMDIQDPAWQADDPDGRSGAPVEGHGLVAL